MQPQYGMVSAGEAAGCNDVAEARGISPDSTDDGEMLGISVVGLCVLDPAVADAIGSIEGEAAGCCVGGMTAVNTTVAVASAEESGPEEG